MENFLGLLRIRVHRGVNLAIRDMCTSDPYIVIKMGKQVDLTQSLVSFADKPHKKLKTRVIKKNINPEWNDELTLSVEDANLPIKLKVYDKDTLSLDDKMGDAEFDIKPFMEAVNMGLSDLPNGKIITKVLPSKQNCLSEESRIMWDNGKVVQEMCLRLRNTESGVVELDLQWIDLPNFCLLEGEKSVHATS